MFAYVGMCVPGAKETWPIAKGTTSKEAAIEMISIAVKSIDACFKNLIFSSPNLDNAKFNLFCIYIFSVTRV